MIAAVRQQTKHAFGQEIPVGRHRVLLIDELVAADPKIKAACRGQSRAEAMEKEILKQVSPTESGRNARDYYFNCPTLASCAVTH